MIFKILVRTILEEHFYISNFYNERTFCTLSELYRTLMKLFSDKTKSEWKNSEGLLKDS